MSRTASGAKPRGPVLLPPAGDRLRSMARELGWEIDSRAQNVVIISPAGKRITLPYAANHPDWTQRIPAQAENSGLLAAYVAHQEASKTALEDQALADFLQSAGEAFANPSTAPVEPKADVHDCSLCGKEFPTPQRLGSHRFQVHDIRGTSDSAIARYRESGIDPAAVAQAGAPAAVFKEPSDVTAPAPAAPKPMKPRPFGTQSTIDEPRKEVVAVGDETKDFDSAMQMLRDEFLAGLARAKENAPAPEVVQERDALKAKAEQLESRIKGFAAENDRLGTLVSEKAAELESLRAETSAQLDGVRTAHADELNAIRTGAEAELQKLQKRVSSLDGELQQLRDFWGFVVKLMDGNTTPIKAYNLISARVIKDSEGE